MEFEYNLGAIGIPIFLVLMLFEYIMLKLQGKSLHTYSDSVTSASMGACLLISESLLKVFTFGIFVWVWDNYRIFDFKSTSLITWVLFFFGVEFCYYWFHRIAHERNILWGAHEGHHQGEEYNFTTAIRQSAFQYGFSWIFYLPLAVLGCPPEVYLLQFLLLKAYQFWIHTQGIGQIPVLEGIFSTPSSHRVHHAKNPIYIDRNYGGTMVIWDRLFGTYQPELSAEPCHYGTTNAPNTLSPVKLNLRHWRNLIHDTIKTEKMSDKIGLWFKPTGWRPADCVGENHHLQKEGTANRPKYDPYTTMTKRIYAGVSTLLTFTAGTMFIFLSPQIDITYRIIGAVILVSGVIVATSLLENRNKLIPLELVRLPCILAMIYALWTFPVTTTIVDTVSIEKKPEDALYYATSVDRWPEWHPSSSRVLVDKTGPLVAGDRFSEDIETFTGQNHLEWQVEFYESGKAWSANANNTTNGAQISLSYRVTETATGKTEFERRLDYTLPNFALVAANAMFYKTKVEEKSEAGLMRLKAAIEKG